MLQRAGGNAAVGALLHAGLARAKLRVGSPLDANEIQADRSADAFVQANSLEAKSSPPSDPGGSDDCTRS